jgi:site-specific recombinase XerC
MVRDRLESQKEAVRGGVWVASDKARYGEFLDRYLEEVASHSLRPQTFISYKRQIVNRIKPELGNMRIASIRPDHLQRFYSNLINSGLSKSTVKYIHCIISKTLGLAVKQGLVARNVAQAVSSPTPDPYEIKPLTIDQAKQFLHVMEGDRLYAFYVLLLSSRS